MIATVTAVNVRGTRQSADVQSVATVAKAGVIVLLALTLIAMSAMGGRGAHSHVWWPERFSPTTAIGGVTGMIGVLWAYEGWQYVTFSADENVDPQRTFGRGIVVGTALLIAIYVLANVGYFSALGIGGVAGAPAWRQTRRAPCLGHGRAESSPWSFCCRSSAPPTA